MASHRGLGVATEVALKMTKCLMPCTYMEYKVILAFQRQFSLNPNTEGVLGPHLTEGGGHIVPPLVNTVLMAQTS